MWRSLSALPPPRRRTLLRAAARLLVGATLIDMRTLAALAAAPGSPVARSLSRDQAIFVGAVAERIWPGARNAGAVAYINRSLAGAYASDLPSYRIAVHRLDAAARRRFGKGFAAAGGDQQDALLRALEAGTLREIPGTRGREMFAMLRQHVIEGVLSDPSYGGNRDFAGWKAVGYPGPRRSFTAEQQATFGPLELPYQGIAALR
jgi:gluconate 2-dehydrogenase subunit 3-like protein